MTTEAEAKKTLKPDDVERWSEALVDYTSRGAMSSAARVHADECIAALRAAALEGAKLALSLPGPGAELLTEQQRQVAALQEQLGAARDSEHAARVRAMEHATKADALQTRVTGLDVANAALQAQVADLTQRRAALVDRREGLRAERDASRLEVENFKAALRRLDALLCFRTRWRVGDGGVTDTSGIDEVFATFRKLLGWEGAEVVDPAPLPPSPEVSALQAKVAELEAKVTQAHVEWDAATDRATEATAERDALRARVDEVESIASHVVTNGYGEDVEMLANRILNALDTPPAEAKKPDPGDGQKPHLPDDVCHANRDGDCGWKQCPQIRDGEPRRSGRHCPFDTDPHPDE